VLAAVRRRPGRLLLILVLLGIIAFSLYVPCRLLWVESYFRAAQAALEARQLGLARQHLTTYLEVWPNSCPAHLLMARTARRAGLFVEAERRLDICERLQGTTEEVSLERALLAVQQGDLTSEAWLRDLLEREPPEAELIREALCQGYRKNYLLRHMLGCLNSWLDHQPGNVPALLQRAWVRERRSDYNAAIRDYRRALQSDPNDEAARLALAKALLHAGQPWEAERLFRRLHEEDPNRSQAALGLALSLRKLGRTEEARQLLDRLVGQHPGQFSIVLERGRLALELGKADEAEGFLRRAVALAPDDYQANYSLSMCLSQRGPSAEAQNCRERVKRIEADMARIAGLTDRLQQRPDDPALRCEIGKLFLRLGEKKEGLFWLQSALRGSPRHPATHRALADYYTENHQPTRAARHRQLARVSGGS
jgi:predicted Zn-dependent protease